MVRLDDVQTARWEASDARARDATRKLWRDFARDKAAHEESTRVEIHSADGVLLDAFEVDDDDCRHTSGYCDNCVPSEAR